MNQDLGRHFLLGEIILKTYQVPGINLFSYTYPNFPFINLHWFSEVIFFLVFKFADFNGLLIFSTLIVLLAFFIIFKKSFNHNLIPITIGSILYLNILSERTDIRPEIFSFLFLSLFTVILYKNREKATKYIFFLPLIELFWVNMHIYFAIGLSVLGIFLIDSIIINRKLITSFFKRKSQFPKQTIYLLIVLILSFLTASINPHGLQGVLYPLYFSQNYGYPIQENQNILFLWQLSQLPSIAYFVTTSLLLIVVLFFNLKKSRLIDWFLALFFIFLGSIAIRNFPLFVFGTFIAFAYNLSSVFPKKPLKVNKVILFALGIVLIYQTIVIANHKGFGLGVEENAKKGADFFIANNLKGPIFNNFDIGSYLDYRLYPKEKVFVDGRPGEYPASFFTDTYIPMQYNMDKFYEVEKKYKFNIVFFSFLDQTPWANTFLKNISSDQSWAPVYLDDYIVIFIKNNSRNKALIDRFKINKEDVQIADFEKKNKRFLFRLAVFASKTGWVNLGEKSLKQILIKEPNDCSALLGLISILQTKNDPTLNIYLTKYNTFCR